MLPWPQIPAPRDALIWNSQNGTAGKPTIWKRTKLKRRLALLELSRSMNFVIRSINRLK